MKSVTRALCAALTCLFIAPVAAAADYPTKPIRLIVPYPAGGITDKIAREVANELQNRLRQNVIVENRAGAAGNIGLEWVTRQPADGYTLALAPASNLTVQDVLFQRPGYSASDFAPVSLLVNTPQLLLTHPSVPVNDVNELIEYSKANPGKVNYGVTLGAYSHLAGELLNDTAGANFTAIPYQGAAQALTDLLGGQTQFIFNEVTTAMPHVQAGRLKPLALAYRTRAPWMPDVPTMAEEGFADFEVLSWYALVAPSGTPEPVIERLSREVHDIMQSPAMKERYDAMGAFTVGSTPAELQALIESETQKWQAVAKQAGIEPN